MADVKRYKVAHAPLTDDALPFDGTKDGRYVIDKLKATVFLLPGERLSVWGRFSAQLMAGEAIVTGFALGREEVQIRAPLCHAAVSVYCPAAAKAKTHVPGRLSKHAIGCVLVLMRQEPEPLLAHLFASGEAWLRVAAEVDAAVELFPSSWQDAVSNAIGGKVMVCGNRGVGKSTLFRYIVNRMLQKHPVVAVVDIVSTCETCCVFAHRNIRILVSQSLVVLAR
jgi:hypothetical protein